MTKKVNVKPYVKKDGTFVKGYERNKPQKTYRIRYHREADMSMIVEANDVEDAITKGFDEEHIDDDVSMFERIEPHAIDEIYEVIENEETGKKTEKEVSIIDIDFDKLWKKVN